MSAEVRFQPVARRKLAKLRKSDPKGIDLVLDAINLLRSNPRPPGSYPFGSGYFRIHVGVYRVMYAVDGGDPVIISVENVGRIP